MKQKLSPAEKNVGCYLALGYTKKEIAAKRKTSESTIRHQAESLYIKTNSKNLADITRYVISQCLNTDVKVLSAKITSSFISVFTLFLSQWVACLFNAFKIESATLSPIQKPCSL